VAQSESGVVGRNKETNDKGSTQVEDEDTDVDLLDGTGQVPARVLGFSSGDGDNLGTNVGEGAGTSVGYIA
jgi:hypothetical protein